MSYGTPTWRPWVLDEAAAQPFFRLALDRGINFFDTADMYSLGVSEEVTGRALRSMAKLDEIVIATKVFYPMNDRPNMGGLSRKHVVQACERSLRRLGIDDDRSLSDPPLRPPTPIDETLEALDHARAPGARCATSAPSTGYAWEIMRALGRVRLERLGAIRPDAAAIQPHLSRGRARAASALPRRRARRLPWSPLARGLLTRPRAQSRADGSLDERSNVVRLYVEPTGRSSTPSNASRRSAASRWRRSGWRGCFSKRDVTAPIIGATQALTSRGRYRRARSHAQRGGDRGARSAVYVRSPSWMSVSPSLLVERGSFSVSACTRSCRPSMRAQVFQRRIASSFPAGRIASAFSYQRIAS